MARNKVKKNPHSNPQRRELGGLVKQVMGLAEKHDVDTPSDIRFCPKCGSEDIVIKTLPAGMASANCKSCRKGFAIRTLK